jgi:outer membrane receptor protein involved in Fe transport
MAMCLAAPLGAAAQDAGNEDVIIVTAQKREQSLQDVPVSINVLDDETLEQRNIQGFNDYAFALPSVSFLALGPGQSEIFFRGLSDGGNGNPSGTAPSAAIYLDEQPVTTIGANLDLQIYDVARIEALSGPQSTLFGASSQTGTLRIVTNAPSTAGYEAGFDIGANTVAEGGEGYSLEGFVNIPLSDRMALRLVGWHVENAGYIDNVAATKTFSRNGQTVSNDAFVEDDFNTETKTGARAALGIDLDENWTATIRALYQNQETEGVFDHDPEDVGDLEVERFFDDGYEDEFLQLSGTIEGRVAGLDLTYSGSYLDRETLYVNDYSEYADYSAYIDYYTCDYAYSYVSYAYEFFNCNDPRIQFENRNDFSRTTHELRLLTDADRRARLLAGLFYDRQEQDYIFDYRIPAIKPGFAIDFTGDAADDSYFVTDQVREDEQIAVFGEVEFDVTDALTAAFGYRYTEVDTSLKGFVGTVFSATPEVDVATEDSQSLYKANITYRWNPQFLTYATFSQGFRPGGANRIGTSNIPLTFRPDIVDNYEIGWKGNFFDYRLRLNGAIFFMEWTDIQFTRFDPSESQLGLTNNAGAAEATGVEVDFAAQVSDSFTLSGGFTALNAELTEDFTQDISAPPGSAPDAPSGTDLPFAPSFKGSLSGRYERDFGAYDGFAQADVSHTSSTYNDLFPAARAEQDAYTLVNISVGATKDKWSGSVFVSNLTGERPEIYINAADFDTRVTTSRPRTFGISMRYRY